MDAELAKKRRADGLRRYHRQIEREVEHIFEAFPEAQNSAADFKRIYESHYRKLDFIYVRSLANFKDAFGTKVTAEDAEWGSYRPIDDNLLSMKEIDDKVEKMLREQNKWEAKQAKKKPAKKSNAAL